MLSIMRKKAGSWMLKVILGIIALVFVFWGFGRQGADKLVEIATVNGEAITKDEFDRQYEDLKEEYRRSLGQNFNEEIIEALKLKDQALESLIKKRLLLEEAQKLHFEVTDEELDAIIIRMPTFQKNGRFDENTYSRVLRFHRLTPEAFKTMQREAILIEKLRVFITSSAKVSEKEAREWYCWENAEVNIDVVQFNPGKYANIGATIEEEKSFYDNHKNTYKIEPKIKVQFIRIRPDAYRSDTDISDEMVQEYYESNPQEFDTPKTVEARHILVKVDSGVSEEIVQKAKQRALAIMKMARNNNDFAGLAKQYSDGPSGENGGYLGVFSREKMVKPFADAAFSMKAGEISEPVRTQFGWHIIKVEAVNEAVVISEKEAKRRIFKKLIEEKAKNIAYDTVDEVYDTCLDMEDLGKAAKEKGLPITTTGFFSRNMPVQQVADQKKFKSIAFNLMEGEISDIHDFKDGYYILQVTDRMPERIPELKEVRRKVRSDLIKDKQNKKAAEDAKGLLEALRNGTSMVAESRKYNLAPKSTGFFKRNDEIPNIGYEKEIPQVAFKLSKKTPLPEKAIHGKDAYYVIRLKNRKEPDDKEFYNNKNDIIKRLLAKKQSNTFELWLSQVKRESEITIEEDFKKL